MLSVDSRRRHCLMSCISSTSSIVREWNTQELKLSVQFIVFRRKANLMHNTRALIEGHLSASLTTLLAVVFGSRRMRLPISACSFFSRD